MGGSVEVLKNEEERGQTFELNFKVLSQSAMNLENNFQDSNQQQNNQQINQNIEFVNQVSKQVVKRPHQLPRILLINKNEKERNHYNQQLLPYFNFESVTNCAKALELVEKRSVDYYDIIIVENI